MATEIPTRDELLVTIRGWVNASCRIGSAGEARDDTRIVQASRDDTAAEKEVYRALDVLYAALASREQDTARLRWLDAHGRGAGCASDGCWLEVELNTKSTRRRGMQPHLHDVSDYIDAARGVATVLSERRANGEAPITDSLGSGK